MRSKFFTTSEKSWASMLEALKGARESVYLSMYIFSEDMPEYDFFKTLKAKAEAGLSVRVVLDSFGSLSMQNSSISKLRSSGVEVLFMSSFFHRLHRKILVIDERVAFLGGVNLHQEAIKWQDLMVRIEGRIVSRVVRAFARDYANAGGVDPLVLLKNKKVFLHKAQTWIVEHMPIYKRFGFKSVYKKQILNAKHKVVLVTPYFAPKRWLLALLHQATLRGVKVEVLVPEKVEHWFLTKTNYFYMARAYELGGSVSPRTFYEPRQTYDYRWS